MFHHTHGKDWYRQSDVTGDPRRAGTGQSQDNISVRVCCSIAVSLARNWSCSVPHTCTHVCVCTCTHVYTCMYVVPHICSMYVHMYVLCMYVWCPLFQISFVVWLCIAGLFHCIPGQSCVWTVEQPP